VASTNFSVDLYPCQRTVCAHQIRPYESVIGSLLIRQPFGVPVEIAGWSDAVQIADSSFRRRDTARIGFIKWERRSQAGQPHLRLLLLRPREGDLQGG